MEGSKARQKAHMVDRGTKRGIRCFPRSGGEGRTSIFAIHSNGIKSNGDAYIFNFNGEHLAQQAGRMVEEYNATFDRWRRSGHQRTSKTSWM